jgi:hypothetical protein
MTEKTSAKAPAKKRAPRKASARRVAPSSKEEKFSVHRVSVREVKQESMPSVSKKKEKAPVDLSLSLYRRLTVGFVGVVAIALLTVLYLSTLKVTVYVTPISEEIVTEFVVDVVSTPVSESQIGGQVFSGSIGRTQTFTPTGEGSVQVDDIATGVVEIFNTSSANQALVKTTRLLTSDGILFRLSEGVTVPASGSVQATVYADASGISGNIEPTTFTIPGLSQAKQEVIYAESHEAFSGGVRTIAVITQAEMESAAETLKATLVEDALSMLRAQAGEAYEGEAAFVETIEQTFSIEPDTQAEVFDVTLSLSVSAVFYDAQALADLAEKQLYAEMGQGRQLVDMDEEGMEVSPEKFDISLGNANLHVILTGRVMASRTSDALEMRRFVGMNEEEIQAFLVQEGVATRVRMECFPFWVHRVPRFLDHVYLELE